MGRTKKTCSNCEFFEFESRGIYGGNGACVSDQQETPNTHEDDSCQFWKKRENQEDLIFHPSHYCDGRKYEPVKVINDWGLGFNTGNAVKYISRAGRKPGNSRLKDLEKAKQYLEFEIGLEKSADE